MNTTRWQTLHYSDLLREEWEDEWFIFHPASGNTHVLNRLAIDILDRLHMHSASLPELARSLIEDYHPDEPSRFTAHLEHHLRHLDELGLIIPQPDSE